MIEYVNPYTGKCNTHYVHIYYLDRPKRQTTIRWFVEIKKRSGFKKIHYWGHTPTEAFNVAMKHAPKSTLKILKQYKAFAKTFKP